MIHLRAIHPHRLIVIQRDGKRLFAHAIIHRHEARENRILLGNTRLVESGGNDRVVLGVKLEFDSVTFDGAGDGVWGEDQASSADFDDGVFGGGEGEEGGGEGKEDGGGG